MKRIVFQFPKYPGQLYSETNIQHKVSSQFAEEQAHLLHGRNATHTRKKKGKPPPNS
ncbi:hypothetical protein COCNU_contig68793392G000010 [Cocos nucifera]|nr:hypothetical protein [Cocos nucifera]